MWWINNPDNTYTIWMVNPYEYGVPETVHAIKLEDDFNEKFNSFLETLKPGWAPRLDDDGNLYGVYIGLPEDNMTNIEKIVLALRNGINSI